MELWVVSLRPLGPWHVGESPAALEGAFPFPPADTVFGALCHAWRQLWGIEALESLLDRFVRREPPFLLSSLFPEGPEGRYFPTPLYGVPRTLLGRTRWLPQEAFEALSHAREWSSEMVGPPLVHPQRIARVAVGRNAEASVPYEVGAIFPTLSLALFCLVDVRDPVVLDRLTRAFVLAADNGIGGQRNRGFGRFDAPKWETLTLSVPEGGKGRRTLSP